MTGPKQQTFEEALAALLRLSYRDWGAGDPPYDAALAKVRAAHQRDAAEKRAERLSLEIEEAQEAMEEFGLREHKMTVAGAVTALGKRAEAAEREAAHKDSGCEEDKQRDEERIAALEREVGRLRAALLSIEKNSCCAPCQEAGLVARAALRKEAR